MLLAFDRAIGRPCISGARRTVADHRIIGSVDSEVDFVSAFNYLVKIGPKY